MSLSPPTAVSIFGVEPFRVGGNESWCREIARQLGERGWRIVLCFLKPPSPSVLEFLQPPNVSFEVIENSWQLNARAAGDVWKVVRKYRPRVLHLHFTGFVSPYPWIAKFGGVERVFFTDQGSREEGYVPVLAPLFKRMASRVIHAPTTALFSISDYNLHCLEVTGMFPAGRMRRVYNSVDFERVDNIRPEQGGFRRKYGIPEHHTVVMQTSWVIPEKGFAELLEAARIVLARNRDVHFVMVGEGAWRERYTKQAAEMGIADRVIWTGLVENPLAEGVFAAADIVCQMSRWEEAFGWVIAEAMAFSKPLVATRVGGIPELVSDGRNGFLVNRGDSQAMAERLLQLLTDRDLRQRMGVEGRRLCEEKFDLRRNVATVVKFYGA